ncbi:hypothetical protein AVEN_195696-1 [Araneus ventricosus]|uniref:Uncharacterized protein n=1 Tax=Araneus ventricosus TaxID=182803 RepID=A0A4Y2BBB0_ARAVE|nr:hypothetical protein AVEN_195696-1 [Araneus ventricosus]
MSDTYSACSVIARLDITVRFLDFSILFEIVIVSRSLPENGAFESPEAELGGNGTDRKTGLSRSNHYGHIKHKKVLENPEILNAFHALVDGVEISPVSYFRNLVGQKWHILHLCRKLYLPI